MRYYVRSSDGADYLVAWWQDGEQTFGGRGDAMRELRMLDESGAYVWGRS
jgi:hypothetical protein